MRNFYIYLKLADCVLLCFQKKGEYIHKGAESSWDWQFSKLCWYPSFLLTGHKQAWWKMPVVSLAFIKNDRQFHNPIFN